MQEEEGEAAKENKWILGSHMLNWGPKSQREPPDSKPKGIELHRQSSEEQSNNQGKFLYLSIDFTDRKRFFQISKMRENSPRATLTQRIPQGILKLRVNDPRNSAREQEQSSGSIQRISTKGKLSHWNQGFPKESQRASS